jgi:hypothetical protein
MVVPKKFNEWRSSVIFRPGVKIRAYHMYRDFVDSCNGSFRRLSKGIFYNWIRSEFENLNEGSDAKGLWFMIGGESSESNQKLNRVQLRKLTSDEFVTWLDEKYYSLLYSKYHSSEIRADFLKHYNITDCLVTKQRFNKWMEHGVNYKGGVITSGRDTAGIFIVIS